VVEQQVEEECGQRGEDHAVGQQRLRPVRELRPDAAENSESRPTATAAERIRELIVSPGSALRRVETPTEAIEVNSMMDTPPTTGSGSAAMIAPVTGMKPMSSRIRPGDAVT